MCPTDDLLAIGKFFFVFIRVPADDLTLDKSAGRRPYVSVTTLAMAIAIHLLEGVLADATFEAHFVVDASAGFHSLCRVHRLGTHVTLFRLWGLQSNKQFTIETAFTPAILPTFMFKWSTKLRGPDSPES